MRIEGRRTLVTGGAGFVGSFLCPMLRTKDLFVPRRRDYDLTEISQVRKLFDDTKPEIVVHLAAEVGGIGANRANPGRFFFANMAMGLNLIEESRKRGVEKFVQIGTICAYPKFTPVPFLEENLWNGYPEETNAPYGVAKKALLVMLQAYREQYNFNGIYLLPVNLYGPGDNFDPKTSHVIPALIRKCVEAKESGASEVRCWGSGEASREFLYVSDCANAIRMALDIYDGPEPVNLGVGFEIKIRDLAEKIAKLTGFTGKLVWDREQPDGQPRRCLDTTRAKKLFGFKAQIDLDVGLNRTIQWFRSCQSH